MRPWIALFNKTQDLSSASSDNNENELRHEMSPLFDGLAKTFTAETLQEQYLLTTWTSHADSH